MTYEHDFERNKVTGSELGDYQNSPATGSSSKWLLLTLIAVVFALGAVSLFSSNPANSPAESTAIQSSGNGNPATPVIAAD